MKQADILILGAGCAGTSLAHYLEDFGYAGKVVLLDSRTKFDREQRWCSWANLPKSLEPVVQKSWKKWTVCDDNNSTVQTSAEFSYQQIYAPDFFARFHSRWKNSEKPITLVTGEKVETVEDKSDFVEITTNRETWRANLVFDARHQGSANLKNVKTSNGTYLHQTFFGWTVKFPRAVFDEETATLMDFRTKQTDGINFIYVLPYSDREALVESTSFSQNPAAWLNHLQSLEKYIRENFGGDYEITAEESGELPMTTVNLPIKTTPNLFSIGVAGGSARPSSGYAFHRIQRQTSDIARAILQDEPISQSVASRKYDFFDTVFLELILQNPKTAQESFCRLFANVKTDALIRFLLDESSLTDDLAVISALPKMRFCAVMLQSFWRKLMMQDERKSKSEISIGTLPGPVDNSSRRLVARRMGR